jgi:hypothetical protein
MKELKARKIALKKEMEQIQGEIETSLREVQHGMADRTRVRYWVEKYPLHFVGSALLAGFLLARRGGRRPGNSSPGEDPAVVREAPRTGFSSLLMDEFKKLATQRAVRYVMQRVEKAIDERSKKEE